MAICRADYELFKKIHSLGILTPRRLLELGEASIYGDVPRQELFADVKAWGTKEQFVRLCDLIHGGKGNTGVGWDLAKVVYEVLLSCDHVDSIDLHGSDRAAKIDLNHVTKWDKGDDQYDIVFNTGTAEHVFRIGRVLEYAHNQTKPGGLMIHCFPFSGLIDHGFYNINPTLIFDLARANRYEILWLTLSVIDGPLMWLNPETARTDIRNLARDRKIPENSWLHVVYRKVDGAPFEIPRQSIYCENPDPQVLTEWMSDR
jgi:hypothetical protein